MQAVLYASSGSMHAPLPSLHFNLEALYKPSKERVV